MNWVIKPWEWAQMPEWWVERIYMYLLAKAEVAPVLQRRREQRANRG